MNAMLKQKVATVEHMKRFFAFMFLVVLQWSLAQSPPVEIPPLKRVMLEIYQNTLTSSLEVCQSANGFQCTAGVYPPEVPADGESVQWVVLRLTSLDGQPAVGFQVDLSISLGHLMPFAPVTITDQDGMAIFAVRAPLFPGEGTSQIQFPQLPLLQLQLGQRFCLPGSNCSNNQESGEVNFRYSWSQDAPLSMMPVSPFYPEMDQCGGQFAGVTRLDVSGQRGLPGVGPDLIVQKFVVKVPERDAGDHFDKEFYPYYTGGCRGEILLPCLDCNRYNFIYPSPVAFALNFMSNNHLPGGEYESHSLHLPVDADSEFTAFWIRYSMIGSRAGQQTLSARSNNLRIELAEGSPSEFIESDVPENRRTSAFVNILSGQQTRLNAPDNEKAILRVSALFPNSGPQVVSQSRVSIPAENVEIRLPTSFPIGVYPYVVDVILPVSRGYSFRRDVDSTHSYWNRLPQMSGDAITEFQVIRNAPFTFDFYGLQPLGFQPASRTFDFLAQYTLQSHKPSQGSRGQFKVFDSAQRLIYTHELLPNQLRVESNGPLFYANYAVTIKIPENLMVRFGRYTFVLEVFDSAGQLYKVAQNKRAFPAKASQVYDPPKIDTADFQVVFSNQSQGHDNDIQRASPYVNDLLRLNVIIHARDSSGTTVRRYHYHPFTGNAPWFSPGAVIGEHRGEAKSFDAPNRISTNTLPWTGPKLDFHWYELSQKVNRSSERGPVSRSINGNVHRYFVYPEFRPVTLQNGSNIQFDTPGTRRIAVRVGYQDYLGNSHWSSSPAPTPGRHRANHYQLRDLAHPPQPNWSFNCDSSHELAVRISIRERQDQIENVFKRNFLEWCASFLEVPYEWGGGWYGGRSDERANVTNVDNGDEGYGIDCSGLISSAAGLAGAAWGRTKRGTYGLRDFSDPIDIAELEPGDILLKPGSHVLAVKEISQRIYNRRLRRWNINGHTIEASGDRNKVIEFSNVSISNFIFSSHFDSRTLQL